MVDKLRKRVSSESVAERVMTQIYSPTGSTIEHTGQSSLAVSIEGHDFLLLAKRGLYWLGNHDRGVHALTKNWPIEIVESGTSVGSLSISHFSQEPSSETNLLLCGHLHPAYYFSSKTDSVGKLPCFWLSKRQLAMPAIGQFTGTQIIKPRNSDQTWVIVDDQIVRV